MFSEFIGTGKRTSLALQSREQGAAYSQHVAISAALGVPVDGHAVDPRRTCLVRPAEGIVGDLMLRPLVGGNMATLVLGFADFGFRGGHLDQLAAAVSGHLAKLLVMLDPARLFPMINFSEEAVARAFVEMLEIKFECQTLIVTSSVRLARSLSEVIPVFDARPTGTRASMALAA